jgi:hypothetical protein
LQAMLHRRGRTARRVYGALARGHSRLGAECLRWCVGARRVASGAGDDGRRTPDRHVRGTCTRLPRFVQHDAPVAPSARPPLLLPRKPSCPRATRDTVGTSLSVVHARRSGRGSALIRAAPPRRRAAAFASVAHRHGARPPPLAGKLLQECVAWLALRRVTVYDPRPQALKAIGGKPGAAAHAQRSHARRHTPVPRPPQRPLSRAALKSPPRHQLCSNRSA